MFVTEDVPSIQVLVEARRVVKHVFHVCHFSSVPVVEVDQTFRAIKHVRDIFNRIQH